MAKKKSTAFEDDSATTIGFDAGKSTEIYGKSNTVQSPAIQTLIIIKVWKAGGWTEFPAYTELLLDAIKPKVPDVNQLPTKVFDCPSLR